MFSCILKERRSSSSICSKPFLRCRNMLSRPRLDWSEERENRGKSLDYLIFQYKNRFDTDTWTTLIVECHLVHKLLLYKQAALVLWCTTNIVSSWEQCWCTIEQHSHTIYVCYHGLLKFLQCLGLQYDAGYDKSLIPPKWGEVNWEYYDYSVVDTNRESAELTYRTGIGRIGHEISVVLYRRLHRHCVPNSLLC